MPGPGSGVGISLTLKGESLDSWMNAFIVFESGGEVMVKLCGQILYVSGYTLFALVIASKDLERLGKGDFSVAECR